MALPAGPELGMRLPKRTDGKPPGGGPSCSTFMSCTDAPPVPRASHSVLRGGG